MMETFVRVAAVVAAFGVATISPALAIVGGEGAAPRAYPFMVALLDSRVQNGNEPGSSFCGGTLVAERWVMTAAQCVYWNDSLQSADQIDIYAGSDDLTAGDRIKLDRIVVHPQFKLATQDNDIALLHLQRPPRAGLKTGTIKLATDPLLGQLPSARPVTVIGWGRTTPLPTLIRSPKPLPLQTLNLTLAWGAQCELLHLAARRRQIESILTSLRLSADAKNEFAKMLDRDKASVLPPEALCATKQPLSWAPVLLNAPVLAPLQPAPCAGDDGGPLLATEPDGKPVQVGIVSFAVTTANAACGSSETPAAYTNVSAYESWVRSVINGR